MISFLTILLSLTLAAQNPVTVPITRKNGTFIVRNAIRLQSTGGNIPPSFFSSQSASLAGDSFFIAKVAIGTNQLVSLILDTGSTDTYVRAKAININDPTMVDLHQSYTKVYTNGANFTAEVYMTNVSISGLTANLPIGVNVLEYGVSFASQLDGSLGLGLKNNKSDIFKSTGLRSSFLEVAGFSQSQLMCGFYLSSLNDGDSGETTFGGYDSSKFSGSITWFPINQAFRNGSLWAFSITDATVSIGGSTPLAPVSISNPSVQNAQSHTAASYIYLPTTVADAINGNINATYSDGYGVYVMDCASKGVAPDVVFTMGGVTFTVPSTIYVMYDITNNICYSGFQKGADSLTRVVLGIPFLRASKSLSFYNSLLDL